MRNNLLTLLAGFLAASTAQTTDAKSAPRQQYEALLKDHDDLRAHANQAYELAKTQQDRDAAQRRLTKGLEALSLRAVELARANPADPVAIEALAWTLRLQQVPATAQALELLARDHAESDHLIEVCKYASNIFGRPDSIQAERFLRNVLAKNTSLQVRGNACFDFAQFLVDRAKHLRWLRRHPEIVKSLANNFGADQTKQYMACNPDAMLKEADGHFSRVVEEFDDLTSKSGGTPLGERARARLFRLRHLQVGCEVPEIDGCDVNGQRFRLSDYRGKVILLTFCGNWCAPCRALYPKERELMLRFAAKPFVVLSVSSDQDKETLRESIKSGEVTWRCWWDGGRNGPISRGWAISYAPTIFVIDTRGRIRYEDIPGPELDEAIKSLLEEGAVER